MYLLTPLLLNELQRQDRKVRVLKWITGVMLLLGVAGTVGRRRWSRRRQQPVQVLLP